MNDDKVKVIYSGKVEDQGLTLILDDKAKLAEQIAKQKLETRVAARQLLYDQATGKEVSVLPCQDKIIEDGGYLNVSGILSQWKKIVELRNGTTVMVGMVGPKSKGRPRLVDLGKDDKYVDTSIVTIETEAETFEKDVASVEMNVVPEGFVDEKEYIIDDNEDSPYYVMPTPGDKQAQSRLVRQVKTFIRGNIANRFKDLAYNDPQLVHDAADYLCAEIRKLEDRYT